MNATDLDTLTDSALNILFATEVDPSSDPADYCPYCSEGNIVAKVLSRISPDWSSRTHGGFTSVNLYFVGKPYPGASYYGCAPTLARAGVIAGIKAARGGLPL